MRFPAIVLAAFLAACSTTQTEPTQAELKARWNEQNVLPTTYRQDLVAFMHTYLNNPAGVRSAMIAPPRLRPVIGSPGERYVACLRYNARKSDGSYAGQKEAAVIFIVGKLDRFIDPQRGDIQQDSAAREVRELCKDAGYEPFPELQRMTR